MTNTKEIEVALEVDATTGEEVIRPLTPEELAEREVMAAEYAAREAEAQAKADARQSALAKLAAIGLTQEEIEAL
jgi:hypothetical protein